MSPDEIELQIVHLVLCIPVAILFSFMQTIFKNRNLKRKPKLTFGKVFWSIVFDMATGVAMGICVVVLSEILNIQDLAWRLAFAMFFGWIGFEDMMKFLETQIRKKFFNENQNDCENKPSKNGSQSDDIIIEDPVISKGEKP